MAPVSITKLFAVSGSELGEGYDDDIAALLEEVVGPVEIIPDQELSDALETVRRLVRNRREEHPGCGFAMGILPPFAEPINDGVVLQFTDGHVRKLPPFPPRPSGQVQS